jgi:3-deoxy-D-manno-octulosonate cytidylyltransferase
MGSSRFPGKPLIDLAGKPMIQWVVEAARASEVTNTVIVATPDQEILDACELFGAQAVLTRSDHVSGTDRIAEVASGCGAEVYINVQGDEPLIDAETIRACAGPLLSNAEVMMSSVYCECAAEELDNPAAVKVVMDREGNALYFSRFPIPYPRNSRGEGVKKHIGLYGYRREILHAFASWAPTPLETAESLEQLRFLEHGVSIRMSEGRPVRVSVDTPEQAEIAQKFLLEKI